MQTISLSAIGTDIAAAAMGTDDAIRTLNNATQKTVLALLVQITDCRQDNPEELNQFLIAAMRSAILAATGCPDFEKGSKADNALASANRRIRKAITPLNAYRKAAGLAPLFFWPVKGNRHGSLFTSKPPVEKLKTQAAPKQVTAKGKGLSQMAHADAPDTAASIKADTAAMATSLAPRLSPEKQLAAWLADGSLSLAAAGKILAAANAKADAAAAKDADTKKAKKAAAIVKTGLQKAAAAAPAYAIGKALQAAMAENERKAANKKEAAAIESRMVANMAAGG